MKQLSIHITITTAFTLLMIGMAYQHFFWYTPYLEFLWTESLFRSIVEFFHLDWTQFTSHPLMSFFTDYFSFLLGIVFLLAALSSLNLFHLKFQKRIISASTVIFLIFAFINWFEHDLFVSTIFERSSQIGCILIMYFLYHKPVLSRQLVINIIKICTALTFTFHGLFALNILPLPGYFVDMTISILGVNEAFARNLLSIIGILDILISFGLFFHKTAQIALVYAVIWGFLTASARIVANISLENWIFDIHRWFFEFLIRTPNFLLPLAGILLRTQNVIELNGFNSIKRKEIA